MESQRIEVAEGERAEVCVRSGKTSFTLVINGRGSINVVISREGTDEMASGSGISECIKIKKLERSQN